MARFGRARRAYGRARRSKYSGKLMNGLLPNGLVKNLLAGLGAAMLAQRFIGTTVPYQDNLVGWAAGGVPGAAAPLLVGYIPSISGGTSGGGTY